MPASGMAMEDVLFTEWLKQPGDMVAPGEAVAVVETDKSTVELSGTTPGRLSRHLVNAGDRVPGGATVAYLLREGEREPGAPEEGKPPGGPSPSAAGGEATGQAGPQVHAPGGGSAGEDVATNGQAGSINQTEPADEKGADGRHTLSPRQRRAVVQQVAPVPVTSGKAPAAVGSSNREATASLVSESWRTVPHFSVGRDIRADGLEEAVKTARDAGSQATVTDYFLTALSRALTEVGEPGDVGLAVATEWGVLVPVLRSLDRCSLEGVAEVRKAAVDRARQRRLGSADAAPAFATLSNLGPQGVTWFTGVVPLNQVALLTVGEVSMRPAVEGRSLVVAPMFTAVLTADHRRYDGVDSARLLGAFAERLGDVIGETRP